MMGVYLQKIPKTFIFSLPKLSHQHMMAKAQSVHSRNPYKYWWSIILMVSRRLSQNNFQQTRTSNQIQFLLQMSEGSFVDLMYNFIRLNYIWKYLIFDLKMESITKYCNIDKDKSLVLEFALSRTMSRTDELILPKGTVFQIDNFKNYPLYIITSGKLSSDTQILETGSLISEDMYERPLNVEEDSKVIKLSSSVTYLYLSELEKYYQQFNCILQSIFKIEINITDKNCIQLIKRNEGALLIEQQTVSKYFFILIDGSCNIRKFFKSDQKQEVSIDLYSFKNYYMLGEEALFSEPYSHRVTCSSDSYLLKVNVEKFCRHLPINFYAQLMSQYKLKHQKPGTIPVKTKSETKTKSMKAQDIIEYYERANQIKNSKLLKLNRVSSHKVSMLEKFCSKNQSVGSDYMNYFVESAEQKVRFELISRGYRKGESVEKMSRSLSKEQMKKLLRKKVVNELKTTGKSKNAMEEINKTGGIRTKLRQKRST